MERVMALKTGLEPLVRKTPGVCGGDACIRRTRIMVWILELDRRWGHSEDEILADYPGLTSEDLQAAWRYAEANVEEIDEAIADNQEG